MINKINDLLQRVEAFAPTTAAEVEEFRIKILGKKGELTALMDEFKSVPAEQKRELGQKINALKQKRFTYFSLFIGNTAVGDIVTRNPFCRPILYAVFKESFFAPFAFGAVFIPQLYAKRNSFSVFYLEKEKVIIYEEEKESI